MKKKLGSGGFTLTETLLAVALLALVSAAGAVVTGSVLSTRNDMMQAGDAQVLTSTVLEALSDEIRFGEEVHFEDETLKLNSRKFGEDTTFAVDGEGRVVAQNASLGEGNSASKLLTDKAYTTLKVAALEFEQSSNGKAITITLTVEGRRGALRTEQLTVAPLNGFTTTA